ncbi:TIGR03752 family integrating conjugative element protein [Thioalkalivibrio sp. ALE9]|uniref:TIGR03752 family integrating conjugative element protein n=1 Tax=Thioalkalivibrio sp. ALE9 TaxID=1158169 RepID=UPI0003683FBD|nr:TIGR03752 family integrating conjugative element protein [Thioalkalivibrio sp. ALE9]
MGGALMVSTKGNRLLPIIGLAVGALMILVMLRSCGTEPTAEAPDSLDQRQAAAQPDADTATDTIRTLTAEQRETRRQLRELREDNQRMREQLAEEARQEPDPERQSHLEGLLGRMDQLSSRVQDMGQQLEQREEEDPDLVPGSDIPIGLGIREDEAPVIQDRTRTAEPESADTLRWTNPVGYDPEEEGGGLLDRSRSVAGTIRDRGAAGVEHARDTAARATGTDTPEEDPRYTVPRNSTLMGSTAMTALIGRVPHGGTVEDPVPFKVIVGERNLAANDIDIPNIEGMIFSGTAMGDWTLSCVRGSVESVTFVFQDGTVRTLPDPDGDSGDTLGWISNEQGVPCIPGDRISNAPAYLAQATGIVTAQAAADAAAAAQTTQIVGQEGFTQNIVTGDTGEFIAGRAASGAAREVAQWLRERQESHFDAVFAPAGETVAVHLDRELRIDYELEGRRVSHEAFERRSTHRTLD